MGLVDLLFRQVMEEYDIKELVKIRGFLFAMFALPSNFRKGKEIVFWWLLISSLQLLFIGFGVIWVFYGRTI